MFATGTQEMKRIQLEARDKKAKKDNSVAKIKKGLETDREQNKKSEYQSRKGGKSVNYDHCEENINDIEEVEIEAELDVDKVEVEITFWLSMRGSFFMGRS